MSSVCYTSPAHALSTLLSSLSYLIRSHSFPLSPSYKHTIRIITPCKPLHNNIKKGNNKKIPLPPRPPDPPPLYIEKSKSSPSFSSPTILTGSPSLPNPLNSNATATIPSSSLITTATQPSAPTIHSYATVASRKNKLPENPQNPSMKNEQENLTKRARTHNALSTNNIPFPLSSNPYQLLNNNLLISDLNSRVTSVCNGTPLDAFYSIKTSQNSIANINYVHLESQSKINKAVVETIYTEQKERG
jgi:hypothetical protein